MIERLGLSGGPIHDDKPRSSGNREGQMKKRVFAASATILLAAATSAAAGDVYVIENSQGKTPIAVKNESFSPAAVPAMGEGKPNQGFSYATAFEMPGSAIQIARGHVDAGGKVAVHEGSQQYILYVVRGNGQLTLIGKTGEVVSQVPYKPDDIIVFQPNTLHGWVNGSEPFDFLGVDLPVLRK
jgi:quercetin dioxygenase-like cupin family protein